MTPAFSAHALKQALGVPGLLAFPLTDFDPTGAFVPGRFADRVQWLQGFGAAAFVIAGGAGEYFSLEPEESSRVLATALEARIHPPPFLATAGGGTRSAIAAARAAERAGADGILLLPPYLTEASQEGLEAHISAVCSSTELGVMVYGRANCRPTAQTLARLCERHPNLIGYKDGLGDLEALWSIRTLLGDRLLVLNGMPTAEVYAPAYRGMGIPSYSSAVFNFVPAFARAFFDAVTQEDSAAVHAMINDFFVPFGRIRARQPGYAVSILKAGAAIVGRDAGPVRPPLSDLTAVERQQLAALIEKVQAAAPQAGAA